MRIIVLGAGHVARAIVDALYEEHPDTLIPDTLLDTARLTEPGTPYWFFAKKAKLNLKKGPQLDVGIVRILLRGLDASSS